MPRSPCRAEAVNVLLPGQVHGARSLLNNTPMEYKLLDSRGQERSFIAGRLSFMPRLVYRDSSLKAPGEMRRGKCTTGGCDTERRYFVVISGCSKLRAQATQALVRV